MVSRVILTLKYNYIRSPEDMHLLFFFGGARYFETRSRAADSMLNPKP